MRGEALYNGCLSQIGDRLKEAHELFGDATRHLLEDRPEDATEALKQAQLRIVGAVALSEWAERLKTNRRAG
jgi:hypothetical protein